MKMKTENFILLLSFVGLGCWILRVVVVKQLFGVDVTLDEVSIIFLFLSIVFVFVFMATTLLRERGYLD